MLPGPACGCLRPYVKYPMGRPDFPVECCENGGILHRNRRRAGVHRRFETGDGTGAAQGLPAIAAVPHMLRSHGTLDLSFRQRRDRTTIDRSYQAGCLRMRQVADGASPCAVLINTAGGVAE